MGLQHAPWGRSEVVEHCQLDGRKSDVAQVLLGPWRLVAVLIEVGGIRAVGELRHPWCFEPLGNQQRPVDLAEAACKGLGTHSSDWVG